MITVRTYLYADESGNFDFSRNPGASRFFLLTTVIIQNDSEVESELLELRRELAWEGVELRDGFHAVNDNRYVRRRVFDILRTHDFRIDATIFEKVKAEPRVRPTQAKFYGFTWYHHMRHVTSEVNFRTEESLVVAASIGLKGMNTEFHSSVQAVNQEVCPEANLMTTMWSASSNTCIQIADYCSWAIFRKWERSDNSSYELVKDKIASEHDLFQAGSVYYY